MARVIFECSLQKYVNVVTHQRETKRPTDDLGKVAESVLVPSIGRRVCLSSDGPNAYSKTRIYIGRSAYGRQPVVRNTVLQGHFMIQFLIPCLEAAFMKRYGVIFTAVLFLLLVVSAGVSAQQDERDKPPSQPAAQGDQATPADEKREPEAKPAQEEEKRTQQGDKNTQEDQKREQKDEKQAQQQEQKQKDKDQKRAEQEDKTGPRVKPGQDAHQAGGATGRIPDDKFRAHFGHEHRFHIGHPTVVSGQPRFQYSGYWFVIAHPWPVGWAYSDDCYIDYVDGEYLLFDLAHPGMSIVVNVVL